YERERVDSRRGRGLLLFVGPEVKDDEGIGLEIVVPTLVVPRRLFGEGLVGLPALQGDDNQLLLWCFDGKAFVLEVLQIDICKIMADFDGPFAIMVGSIADPVVKFGFT